MACFLDPFGCLTGAFWAWIATIPLWVWVVGALVLIGAVWKFSGWPGLLGLAGAVGFILGRRSADPEHEHVTGKDAAPAPRVKRKGKRPTIFDGFKSLSGK